jgi:CheY-like chemotaxis protein
MALPLATAEVNAPLEVLLAEDALVTQSLLSRLLKQHGCNVDTVGDGEQALEALQSRSYDIGLMEFHLPKLDGLSVVARVNATRKASGKSAYFIGITDDVDGLLAHPSNCDNFDLVLPKPIDIVHLCSVVEDFHHYLAGTIRDMTELEPPQRNAGVDAGEWGSALTTRAKRIRVDSGSVVLTVINVRTYACHIVDLSLSGALIEIEVRPPVNARVRLGLTEGRVARHTSSGIAVEFTTVAPLPLAGGNNRGARRAP